MWPGKERSAPLPWRHSNFPTLPLLIQRSFTHMYIHLLGWCGASPLEHSELPTGLQILPDYWTWKIIKLCWMAFCTCGFCSTPCLGLPSMGLACLPNLGPRLTLGPEREFCEHTAPALNSFVTMASRRDYFCCTLTEGKSRLGFSSHRRSQAQLCNKVLKPEHSVNWRETPRRVMKASKPNPTNKNLFATQENLWPGSTQGWLPQQCPDYFFTCTQVQLSPILLFPKQLPRHCTSAENLPNQLWNTSFKRKVLPRAELWREGRKRRMKLRVRLTGIYCPGQQTPLVAQKLQGHEAQEDYTLTTKWTNFTAFWKSYS